MAQREKQLLLLQLRLVRERRGNQLLWRVHSRRESEEIKFY